MGDCFSSSCICFARCSSVGREPGRYHPPPFGGGRASRNWSITWDPCALSDVSRSRTSNKANRRTGSNCHSQPRAPRATTNDFLCRISVLSSQCSTISHDSNSENILRIFECAKQNSENDTIFHISHSRTPRFELPAVGVLSRKDPRPLARSIAVHTPMGYVDQRNPCARGRSPQGPHGP